MIICLKLSSKHKSIIYPCFPEPSSSNLGLGLGLGLTFFLLVVAAAGVAAHRKFGLFTGMCDGLPRLLIFGIRDQGISMVDNGDDDVNPIV